ncbi:hypothetical protein MTR_1g074180 [Medicago truncatula]|uniref:Uncharacterized protein n=1 Tax=Medicago truncatula TaxID=3880 RepID=A0A072VLK4_MEDTR|nr:hypothetical protein MTR_1g074180 [Medicago truncatula]
MHIVNLWDEVEQVVVDFDTPATIIGMARNEPLGRGYFIKEQSPKPERLGNKRPKSKNKQNIEDNCSSRI